MKIGIFIFIFYGWIWVTVTSDLQKDLIDIYQNPLLKSFNIFSALHSGIYIFRCQKDNIMIWQWSDVKGSLWFSFAWVESIYCIKKELSLSHAAHRLFFEKYFVYATYFYGFFLSLLFLFIFWRFFSPFFIFLFTCLRSALAYRSVRLI